MLRMKDAGERLEEIHTALRKAIMELSDSCVRLDLTWESQANQAFMFAISNDYMEMLCLLTYVWDAVQNLKYANGCYQIAEQGVEEEIAAI